MSKPSSKVPGDKVHLAICVKSLSESRAFYVNFFGAEPTKETHDQIDWILDKPPVHFSIYVSENYSLGLEHLGFVLPEGDLERVRQANKAPEGNVFDPDGNKIELYSIS